MIVVVKRGYTGRSGRAVDTGRYERGSRPQSTLPFHRKGDNKSPQNVSCAIPLRNLCPRGTECLSCFFFRDSY